MTVRKNVVVSERGANHLEVWQDLITVRSYVSTGTLHDGLIKMSLLVENLENRGTQLSIDEIIAKVKSHRDGLEKDINGPPRGADYVLTMATGAVGTGTEYVRKEDRAIARRFETNNDDGSHIRGLVSWANSQSAGTAVSHNDTDIFIHASLGRDHGLVKVAHVGDWLVFWKNAWCVYSDKGFTENFEKVGESK